MQSVLSSQPLQTYADERALLVGRPFSYDVQATHGLIFPILISCVHSFDSICNLHTYSSDSIRLLQFGHGLRATGKSSSLADKSSVTSSDTRGKDVPNSCGSSTEDPSSLMV